MLVESNDVITKEEAIGSTTVVAYDAAQPEEVVHSVETLGNTYPAELVWYTQSTSILKLMWGGGVVWEFEV